jgi:hypothetical protein
MVDQILLSQFIYGYESFRHKLADVLLLRGGLHTEESLDQMMSANVFSVLRKYQMPLEHSSVLTRMDMSTLGHHIAL